MTIIRQDYPSVAGGPAFSRGDGRTVVVIDRARWDRGPTPPPATTESSRALLNANGGMCCLGFACVALGFSERAILGYAVPSDMQMKAPSELCTRGEHRVRDRRATNDAISANDNASIGEAERERRVAKAFERLGLRAVFVGEGKWAPPAKASKKARRP